MPDFSEIEGEVRDRLESMREHVKTLLVRMTHGGQVFQEDVDRVTDMDSHLQAILAPRKTGMDAGPAPQQEPTVMGTTEPGPSPEA